VVVERLQKKRESKHKMETRRRKPRKEDELPKHIAERKHF
jgi:hypothetical protein